MSEHICHERDYCVCSSQGLEPDEKCRSHGYGEYPDRCVECGRFIGFRTVPIETIKLGRKQDAT